MDFDNSSQARSWLFDSRTLMQCRQKALTEKPKPTTRSSVARVRRFASGYHGRHSAGPRQDFDFLHASCIDPSERRLARVVSSSAISVHEQELMIRFHAEQIGKLIGPAAVLKSLVRSSSVLATAIVLFRRFFLSNSILDFEPRRIAVAAAYLAAKVEEQRVEMDLLERATLLIEDRMKQSSFGEEESCHVSSKDIAAGERELMEGLNYQMRCHHPYAAIRVLSKEMTTFLAENYSPGRHSSGSEQREPSDTSELGLASSPRQVSDLEKSRPSRSLYEKSIGIAQKALVFSDVGFLYSPGPIAFASVAIASRNWGMPAPGTKGTSPLEPEVKEFLRVRFPAEEEYDVRDFESQVCKIVHELEHRSTALGSSSRMSAIWQSEELNDRQVCEIQRVSTKISALRKAREMGSDDCFYRERFSSPRKRKDADNLIDRLEIAAQAKIPKVTPTRL